MRKIIIIILVFLSIDAYAYGNDSIVQLNKAIEAAQKDLLITNRKIEVLEKQNVYLEKKVAKQSDTIDTLRLTITQDEDKFASMKLEQEELSRTYENKYSTLSSQFSTFVTSASICLVLLLSIAALIFLKMRKRLLDFSSSIEKLRSESQNTDEYRLDTDKRLLELEDARLAFDNKIKSVAKDTSGNKPDHSLALKIANELARIETNLSRMDASVKGYRQLQASVRRIKDHLLANGYEIVAMLGKPYNKGMMVEANFIPDDTLEEGQQIITNVIKPQVNYKGVMLQAAQITVSQN